MILLYGFLFFLSLVILYYGAEFSLESSEKLGKKLNFSPLVIGMLLVGFGTSLPELFVSHLAVFRGQSEVAFGTLIGSNVANGLLILGICSIFCQLPLDRKNHTFYLVIHLLMVIFCFVLFKRDYFDLMAFFIMMILFSVYIFDLFRKLRHDNAKLKMYQLENTSKDSDDLVENKIIQFTWMDSFKLTLGLGFLYGGGELLIYSGTKVCEIFNISTFVISAIFVAFGTSFPELVTSVLSIIKKKDTNLIVGNILGSNIFNCCFILGILGASNLKIDNSYHFEILTLLGFSFFLLLMAFFNLKMGIKTGIMFLLLYGLAVSHWIGIINFNALM